jgi:hypothetical protein
MFRVGQNHIHGVYRYFMQEFLLLQGFLLLVYTWYFMLHAEISSDIRRVGQNRIYTPYMTVYLVISPPKIAYIHRIYMVLANPRYTVT